MRGNAGVDILVDILLIIYSKINIRQAPAGQLEPCNVHLNVSTQFRLYLRAIGAG